MSKARGEAPRHYRSCTNIENKSRSAKRIPWTVIPRRTAWTRECVRDSLGRRRLRRSAWEHRATSRRAVATRDQRASPSTTPASTMTELHSTDQSLPHPIKNLMAFFFKYRLSPCHTSSSRLFYVPEKRAVSLIENTIKNGLWKKFQLIWFGIRWEWRKRKKRGISRYV